MHWAFQQAGTIEAGSCGAIRSRRSLRSWWLSGSSPGWSHRDPRPPQPAQIATADKVGAARRRKGARKGKGAERRRRRRGRHGARRHHDHRYPRHRQPAVRRVGADHLRDRRPDRRDQLHEGGTVNAGDVLVKLDDALAQAEVADAQARYDLAEANNDRAKQLSRTGNVTEKAIDEATANFEIARAALELQRVRLAKHTDQGAVRRAASASARYRPAPSLPSARRS